MGSTYLTRIASLYSEIAVKVGAGSPGETTLAKDRRTSPDRQNGYKNGHNSSENDASQRHATLRTWEDPARDARLGPVALEYDGAEIAKFKAELEVLRLRMIDACLHGYFCTAEPARELVMDRASITGATSHKVDRGFPTRTFQDEVACAVRLLASSKTVGRRK